MTKVKREKSFVDSRQSAKVLSMNLLSNGFFFSTIKQMNQDPQKFSTHLNKIQ